MDEYTREVDRFRELLLQYVMFFGEVSLWPENANGRDFLQYFLAIFHRKISDSRSLRELRDCALSIHDLIFACNLTLPKNRKMAWVGFRTLAHLSDLSSFKRIKLEALHAMLQEK
ncbi:MAG: hypothetical protein A2849_02990 [Candidatus Taylorbacteria bacterium RIFCSPHIGHO2_01_FULL_51_15]|uniref:Uncharacterized protein n=1 Tax=Candidatus Taylorbacteria bacterium RIFCSPHIGHO2_01_FULL_51_15 TaxID=1802304 RepID=A0A1G2MAU1_9BACT|nr:MAG: hypothetical protein A2849_02990 [Candidatus Taylorbacteria bacterium RIFCSPHIGHO2_01_FULL_51_15]